MALLPSTASADVVVTGVYPNFDSTNIGAFQLNGNATLSGNRLQLTPPITYDYGTAWWKNRVSLCNDRSFSTYFTFQISESDSIGADGLVFVIQTQSSGAGVPGGGMGYGGVSPSVGIEFDTYNNWYDLDDNHVGVNTNGSMESLMTATPPGLLENGIWHVWVDYHGINDSIEVRMNTSSTRPESATLTHTMDLEAVFGPDVYVGFTSATGGVCSKHEVCSFYFNNDHIPEGITPDTVNYTSAPTTVELTAAPTLIPADGAATSTISATTKDESGTPLSGQTIQFTTTLGTVNPTSAVTNGTGVATTNLSGTSGGEATVRGSAQGGVYGETQVTFGGKCTCGDICVNETGWWRYVGAFNDNGTPIQAAVDAAAAGETIYVWNGSYTENVDVNKRLTLAGEGVDVVNVTAALASDHVFNVTADYVSILGFNVSGATGPSKAGIYLGSGVDHCNLSDNTASNNYYGIYLISGNEYNTLTNNNANSNNHYGIYLKSSSNHNTLTSNTASNNGQCGIFLSSSINNTLTNNTASNNWYGIFLSSASNNTIYNNYWSNTNNARDNGYNTWNTTPATGTNIIGGSYIGGNYWHDYAGVDTNGDGLGDTLTPYNSSRSITNGGDYYPLVPPDFVAPSMKFISPTPGNGTTTANTSVEINVSITEADDLSELKWNWNGTNYTRYNDSLVLMYNFDNVSALGENNMHVVDMSSGGNNGAVTNAIFDSSGKYGGAFEFDGDGDYVTADSVTSLLVETDFTISAWFKLEEAVETCPTIIGFNTNAYGNGLLGVIYKEDSYIFGIYHNNDRQKGTRSLNDGNWHYMVIVYDHNNGNLNGYIDGLIEISDFSSTLSISANDLFSIGQEWDGGAIASDFWKGNIDEVRIWAVSLSADEVYQQYVSNLNKYDTDGWGLYVNQSKNATDELDDGTYTYQVFATDTSGNGNATDGRTVTIDAAPPEITIDAPTQSSSANRTGGEQFWVNFTYTELHPANYTVTIRNATAVINSTANDSPTSGTDKTVNASFYLNATAANGWYNVTVEMYDNLSNHNIAYQNNSILKDIYDATISQPANQTTNPNMNATYTLVITNTGNITGTFTLAMTNHGSADVSALNRTTITDLAVGAAHNVTLNVADADAGRYNVTVNVTSATGSVVANTSYIMTTVRGPTLTLGNVTDITSNWGRSFSLNHSATATNATATNVNVTYNVSWITDNSTIGTIAKDVVKWHNQTIKNSTVQEITVKVYATSTTGSATNDSETFLVNITRRNIEITSHPESTQSGGTDTTFWINASASDEHGDTLICKADLIREGVIIETHDVTNGNANFSRTESLSGTFNFSVRLYNTTHYNNQSTSSSSVMVNGPALTLGNVGDITCNWGRSFSVNHSVIATNATASNVNVTYNVSWITDNSTMGTIAKGGATWHNQSIENSAVQETTVKVDATSTSGSATNDSGTFQISITKRDIGIVSHPTATQTVDPNTAFHITASASDEYGDTPICKADLIRDGIIIETIDVTNGNVDFSRSESAAGTFDFTIRFYNTTHYNNQSTSSSSVTVSEPAPTLGPVLTLGNVGNITRDWGRSFNLNHSVTVTRANAGNVNVAYNVPWIAVSSMETIAKDETRWHNQSIKNSAVQETTVRVDATSTSGSATNDVETFQVSITKRDIGIVSHPTATQTVDPNTAFRITASASDEYGDILICKADLIRNGIIIETKDITNGNADFSRTDPAAGMFGFTIRFHNTTHYNNQSTYRSSVIVNGPALTLGNVGDITCDWGISFNLNHSVIVTRANANNVNVAYNVPWISGSAMGTIAKDATKWHNQSIEHSVVQETTVRVDATTAGTSIINDSMTFHASITKRDIGIVPHPAASRAVDLNTTFHITASASDEYGDTLICKADLIRNGIVIETIDATNGNADFSRSESAAGTFDFTIRFHNTTHYNDATTSNCTVAVADMVPPIINNVTHTTPTSDSVTITWATDENSDSLVWYGTSTGTYGLSKSGATMVTSHTLTLTGLSSNALYYFVVSSADCSGNSNVSSEHSFRTAKTNGTISGLVTDSTTGYPIRDAAASAGGITIRTWTDGTYTIPTIAPGTYTLNVGASGYVWHNRTVVTVSSGAVNPNGNVGLTPEKVTLATKRGETASKTAVAGNETIFCLTATNYGSDATFTITNSTTSATVGFVSPIVVNTATPESFNVTVSHPAVGIHVVTVTLTNSTYSKSATIKLTACMKNATGVTEINSNTTGGTVTGNETVVTDSNVTSGGSVDNSTLYGSTVTQNATVDDSTVMDSSIAGNETRVKNGSVVDRSTVDNSTMDNGAIAKNSTVTDSAVDNTTATDSELRENTTVTDSTIVNVTANESTITGVEIDTGYDIILINATVEASTSGGNGGNGNGSDDGSGRPEIRGDTNATVITRGINFTNIYTDVLIEDLVLQQTDDETVRKNTSTTINASRTVKCDLTVNMTEPAQINITETGINPGGEGTESILPDDVSDWIPVGSFICIQHNTSGTGSFTIRRYYDPSLNYTEVYIYYYNTTPNPNEWERLETTANGMLGGLNWIEAVVDHLGTFVLMGALGNSGGDGGDGDSSTSNTGDGDGTYPPEWFATPAQTVTAAKAPAASATATTTVAPPGGRVSPATAKTKTAAAETTAAAAGATPTKPGGWGVPWWFTAVFAIVGLLAVIWVVVVVRRRRRE